MDKEIESIIQDILLHELSLPTNYGTVNSKVVPSVYIVAPNVSLGTTEKLQIGIQSISTRVIANHTRVEYETVDDVTVCNQINEATVNDMIQIDLSSKNTDARIRRHEAFMAFNSIYSKQMQEKYGFRLFNLPSGFTNTSAAEGGTTLLRYSITFTCQYMRVYTRTLTEGGDYYHTFPFEDSSELATDEFTIDEDFEPYPSST